MKTIQKIKLPKGFSGRLGKSKRVITMVKTEDSSSNLKPEEVTCFDDILSINGKSKEKFEKKLKGLKSDEVAYLKAKQVTKACNPKGWIPDWENGLYDKWVIWFKMGSSSGVGFAFYGVGHRNSSSGCGSRLVFADKVLAEKMANLFLEEIYKPMFTYSKSKKS